MLFWEEFYKKHKTTWGFEPSDSAIQCANYFKANNINTVLIQGMGYGRNVKPFYESKFELTGIEISEYAIRLARENEYDFPIFQGSLTDMPFDQNTYDGIFCYATLHLFQESERHQILNESYNKLNQNGLMFYNVVSVESMKNFTGVFIEKNVLKLENGLIVTFYNLDRMKNEFEAYNIIDVSKIDEPIKHMENQEPLKCFNVICKKI